MNYLFLLICLAIPAQAGLVLETDQKGNANESLPRVKTHQELGVIFDAQQSNSSQPSIGSKAVLSVPKYRAGAAGLSVVASSAALAKPSVQAPVAKSSPGAGEKILFSLGRFLNMPLNLFKTLFFGSLSLVSNVIEGIWSGITAPWRGDILDAFTWPLKAGLNAAWNAVAMALNATNVAVDPLWQFVPIGDPPAEAHLVGAGPRLRTLVRGGPLGHASKIFEGSSNFVFSSAFIQSKSWVNPQLAHEFGHTLQAQQSFLVDLAIRRGITNPIGVETEAERIGKTLSIWNSSGPLSYKEASALVIGDP